MKANWLETEQWSYLSCWSLLSWLAADRQSSAKDSGTHYPVAYHCWWRRLELFLACWRDCLSFSDLPFGLAVRDRFAPFHSSWLVSASQDQSQFSSGSWSHRSESFDFFLWLFTCLGLGQLPWWYPKCICYLGYWSGRSCCRSALEPSETRCSRRASFESYESCWCHPNLADFSSLAYPLVSKNSQIISVSSGSSTFDLQNFHSSLMMNHSSHYCPKNLKSKAVFGFQISSSLSLMPDPIFSFGTHISSSALGVFAVF